MQKNTLLNDHSVKEFTKFVADRWQSGLDLRVGVKEKGKDANYSRISSLKEALDSYSWQYSIKMKLPYTSFYRSGSSIIESEQVINYCKSKILVNGKISSNDKEIREASEIILRWGGVFLKGNKAKIEDNNHNLRDYYKMVYSKWDAINQQNISFYPNDIINFPSNAGFTKVYSLFLNNYVIYDSRVSVALAYLMNFYFEGSIPNIFKLYIPPSRVVEKAKRQVHHFFEPTYHLDSRHFYSNVVSSILLLEVLKLIKLTDENVTLRELEAALFMIGYDVSQKDDI